MRTAKQKIAILFLLLLRLPIASAEPEETLRNLLNSDKVKNHVTEGQGYQIKHFFPNVSRSEIIAGAVALAEKDKGLRDRAMYVLMAYEATEQTPLIRGYLQNREESSQVRSAALYALSRLYMWSNHPDEKKRKEVAEELVGYATDATEEPYVRCAAVKNMMVLFETGPGLERMLKIAEKEYQQKTPNMRVIEAMRGWNTEPGYTYSEPEKKIEFLMRLMALQASKASSPLSWQDQEQLMYGATALNALLKERRVRLSEAAMKELGAFIDRMHKLAFDNEESQLRRRTRPENSFQREIENTRFYFRRISLTQPIHRKPEGNH